VAPLLEISCERSFGLVHSSDCWIAVQVSQFANLLEACRPLYIIFVTVDAQMLTTFF